MTMRVPNPAPPPGAQQQAAPQAQLPVYAIVSYEYFQRRFGGDPSVIGRSIAIAGPEAPTPIIVGVLEPHFQLYFPPEAQVLPAPDIWLANRLGYDAAQRINVSMHAVGRLRPGVTAGQAQAESEKVAASERAQFPIIGTADYHFRVEPMRQHMVAEAPPAILHAHGIGHLPAAGRVRQRRRSSLGPRFMRNRELAVLAPLLEPIAGD